MKELKTLIVNGNEYTVTDPNAARIDDDSVGQAAWSSKNIVDRLCPAFSESGSVVTCAPVEGYPLEVVSHIRPVQAGSGDPSLENVRPITGHTQALLTRCGKNLYNHDVGCWQSTFDYGFTATKTTAGYSITGTYGGGCFILLPLCSLAELSGRKVLLSADIDGNASTFHFVVCAPDYSNRTSIYAGNSGVFRIPKASAYPDGYIVAVRLGGDKNNDKTAVVTYSNIQVEVGETRTAYEPFKYMDTITLDLGQTVYGGGLNWQTGVLTVNRGMVEMDGSTDENWRLVSSHSDGPGFFYHYLDNAAKENLICDRLRTDTAGVWYGSDNAIYAWPGELRVFVKDIELSVEAFRTWLSENPLHICYQLENPITVQLTAQQILALSGTNTLYSDTGDTTVSGKADPTAVIEKLTNAIIALGGNI